MSKIRFLYNMVELESHPFKTVTKDNYVVKVGEELKSFNPENANSSFFFAELYVYTKDINCFWPDDLSDEYRTFDRISEMFKSKASAIEMYQYAMDELGTEQLLAWAKALQKCLDIWKPNNEKPPQDTNDPK